MDGYVIMKLEADAFAAKDGIVEQFNAYMQRTAHEPSFVHEKEGYFRLSCDEGAAPSSAGTDEFGKFLQSTGYAMTGISSKGTSDGGNGTEITFTRGGSEGRVLVSTAAPSSRQCGRC